MVPTIKMISNTCDVNVIFNLSLKDKFLNETTSYITNCKNSPFVSLRSVRETFRGTFESKLKEISNIIVEIVNKTKEDIEKRGNKLPLTESIEKSLFNKNFEEVISKTDYSKDRSQFDKYSDLLFKRKLSFGELKDSKVLQELWENSRKNAEHISLDLWQSFRDNFTNFREAPRFNSIKQSVWETKIKDLKTKENIFSDVDDEDIYIATEYLTYIEEMNPNLKLSGFDRKLIKSLNLTKQKLKLNYPDSVCLLPN